MSTPLNVLIVDDNPADAELLARELRRSGYEPRWSLVQSETDYGRALSVGLDIILCDYHMPGFSGIEALDILRTRGLDVPFILISGVMGEEAAVAAIKRGAADYLMKDRLTRLGSAVSHAISDTIAERHRRENERELALFRTLVDQSKDTFEVLDPLTGRYLDVNGKGLSDWGYTRSEYLSLTIFDLDPSMSRADWEAWLAALKTRSAPPREGLHTRRGAQAVAVDYDAAWVPLEHDYIVIVVRDISARKADEARIRQSEERFRELAEAITEVFWISDQAKRHIFYVSPGYERVWRRSCESLYLEPASWLDAIHPDDRERIRQSLSQLCSGDYSEEYRILTPDGSERWIRERAFPIRSSRGEVERVASVSEDITESKRLQEQFLRAQRMEALGTLAGGVAHDLNNILSPIMIAPSLLRESTKDPHELELLTMIEQSAQRGSAIVRQLLTFSRGAPGKRVALPMRPLLDEMATLMRETFPKEISVHVFCEDATLPIRADPNQIHQVLLNLCVNARDAMSGGGHLWLCAGSEEWTQDDLADHPGARPGSYTWMSVTDTGPGIPPEVLTRIYDPFFTTKSLSRGTGLGLSTALGIVRSHGGFIDVTTFPSVGTSFSVSVAALEMPGLPVPAASPRILRRGRGEVILLVDSDLGYRAATRLLLERSGYRVLTAQNGSTAQELTLRHVEAIQAVIVDTSSPDPEGLALLSFLRESKTGLQIIMIAEPPSGKPAPRMHVPERTHVILKPLSPFDLLRALTTFLPKGPLAQDLAPP